MTRAHGLIALLTGLLMALPLTNVRAQDQISLGGAAASFQFDGTASSTLNVSLRISNGGIWTWANGGASGSGSLGSSGSYILSTPAQIPMTIQSQGGGNYVVTQGAVINFLYTSGGSWGYPAGSTLLQGTLILNSINMVAGSSSAATASGSLTATGGTFASQLPSGQVSLTLALGAHLDSLLGRTGSISAAVSYPGAITAKPSAPAPPPPPPPPPVLTSDQISLGSSNASFQFDGTATSILNLTLRTLDVATWTWGNGSASGSGTLGSSGSYTFTTPAQKPITLQSLGGGNYVVTQGAIINFLYTSSGSWGYPAGTALLQGTLLLDSINMVAGSSGAATASGNLTSTGGTFASRLPAGKVNLMLVLGASLDSLVGRTGSITSALSYPGAISAAPPIPTPVPPPVPTPVPPPVPTPVPPPVPTPVPPPVPTPVPPPVPAPVPPPVPVPPPAPAVSVTTNSLAAGNIQQPYQAVLQATGGTTPYQWSLASGVLPIGVSLNATTGEISGTPIQSGAFSVSVRLQDSHTPNAASSTKNFTLNVDGTQLDAYGGATQLPCPLGAASHFYKQKIGNRWWLCTPAGNAFWMKGVYAVDPDGSIDFNAIRYSNIATGKYGDANLNWGPQQNRRLKSWGFNSVAEFSSLYVLPTTTTSWPGGRQPVPMPFTALVWPAYYALFNSGGYAPGPAKELVRATNPAVFNGYRAHSPDVWDPNFGLWLDGWLQRDYAGSQWVNGPNNSYLIGLNIDDADTLQGFGAGPDFKTIGNGVASGGREQPHLGWIVLITPPTQTLNTEYNVVYSDTTVYAKKALADFLAQRYLTVAALNSAWGSAYTTFGSAGLWGVGTGLLDEDGTHSWVPKDFTWMTDASVVVKKDLDDFLFLHAQKYFSVIKSVLNLRAPGRLYLGPTHLGTWGTPSRKEILQAAAGYLDVYSAGTIPAGIADDQQRVDFVARYLGDKPWTEWEGFVANPDSYLYPFVPGETPLPPIATQAQRGQAYSNMVNLLMNTRTTAGTYPIVGFKWWAFVDNAREQMNWGLVTRRDNEYDGLATAPTTGTDSWGFPTGGETKSYGNFLGAVQNTNSGILPILLGRIW